LPRNDEAKASATETARGRRVGLLKRLKQLVDLFSAYPDAMIFYFRGITKSGG
jgi:hypothetical protein